MKIQVREASGSDAANIADIYVTSFQSTYVGIIPEILLKALSPAELISGWVTTIESDNHTVFVAESEEGVIGFAHLGQNKDEDLAEEKQAMVELFELYFYPSNVNPGLGTQMWGIIEESLIGKEIVLWTLEGNQPAHHFYIKHGFEQDKIHGEYSFQGQGFPKVRYRKLIT
jgi:ribosomal protein S18 acetylase RimI-like enzyme